MNTQLIRFLYNISTKHQGGVITLGNFDGVHLGHQQLMAKLIKRAKMLQAPSIAITFEPHAQEFFSYPNCKVARLTRLREKFYGLAACNVDYVLVLKFNQALAIQSASDFLSILYHKLKPQYIVVGDDFHFGRNRQGNVDLLRDQSSQFGFSVETLPAVLIDHERISSTKVRQALTVGDHVLVKRLLGRPYSMMGRVRYGDQLGRKLGFPTANIYLHRHLTPVQGIYTVLVHGLAPQPIPGAANVGTRPTVNGTQTLLEVHLLDFNQNIYNRYVEVEFCKKLRNEIHFPNLTMLKEQIANDIVITRNYFKV